MATRFKYVLCGTEMEVRDTLQRHQDVNRQSVVEWQIITGKNGFSLFMELFTWKKKKRGGEPAA